MYHKIMRRLISHPQSAIELCRRFVSRYRKYCPRCGTAGAFVTHHTDKRGVKTFLCCTCSKTFTEFHGTIFYRSKIPLHLAFYLLLLWITSTGSMSAAEGARQSGLSYPTVWKLLMKMRSTFSSAISKDTLSGWVEADEAWFGRKENQDIVMGLVQRTNGQLRKLRLIPIKNLTEKTLYGHIEKHVERKSHFFTDCRISYVAAGIWYQHETVNHSKYEFARGRAHTNTIEQMWGQIKGIIRTIHHGVSKKYRQLYFAQFIFRYENELIHNMFNLSVLKLFHPTYCL